MAKPNDQPQPKPERCCLICGGNHSAIDCGKPAPRPDEPPREWTSGQIWEMVEEVERGPDIFIERSAYVALKAERDELRFELEAKQRPLGEQVLALTIERDAKAKECEELERRWIEASRVAHAIEAENERLREVLERIAAFQEGCSEMYLIRIAREALEGK
jgi:hypothetical protein